MKVQFAPAGIGLGHAGRCVPIAKKLLEKDDETQLIFSTYKDGVCYTRQEGFSVAEVPPVAFKVLPDGTVDFKRTVANPDLFFASFKLLRQIRAEIRVMQHFKPDVVVSDTRVSPLAAARLLRIPRICILNQFQIIIPRRTHFLRLAKFVDLIGLAMIGKLWTTGMHVLIPDFPEPYTLSTGNLRIPKSYQKKVKLIGPIIETRPEELPTAKVLRKKLHLDQTKPVIFAPISGPAKEKAYLIGLLRRIFSEFPEDYQIVLSLGYPTSSPDPLKCGNFSIYKWIQNRFEYLKACDLVVAKAGHGTVAQALCYGKPMILIPTPNHTEQYNNARKVKALGAAELLNQQQLSKENLLKTIEKMLNTDRYAERSKEILKEVGKLDGLETAADLITKAAQGEWSDVPS
ncbi:MAG TPA: UDP-N-acetylglucosamine--N-acetylmuramyl-(pentapeptide) pyrophosphoryl-undecaprenol N-acetylglucosamine transferase [Candidatus Krumholzibacteriaceae bacterium]|nr:UDP-N-acetylglucosamine--N-acetylmuramyl-(pentapeptide) pyrophosphoryl-undecaprenol N-acetylglucosamine transferase [Candidatus Krumholzibacteriaceae bacterium]